MDIQSLILASIGFGLFFNILLDLIRGHAEKVRLVVWYLSTHDLSDGGKKARRMAFIYRDRATTWQR